MNKQDRIDQISSCVEEYLNTNWLSCGIPHRIMVDDDKRNHIIRCGTEIMSQKSGDEFYPGSFVASIIENNLSTAILKADHINQFALRFYVTMMHNLFIK